MHYGNLVAANQWMARGLKCVSQMYADPNQAAQAVSKMILPSGYVTYAVAVGQEEQCIPLFELMGLDWHTADSLGDNAASALPHLVRQRGDT